MAVFFYFIHQRPQELCIILDVAIYMSTRSFLDHYRATDCPHKGHKPTYGGDHAPIGMLAMYMFLHMVQFRPVPKYRLCLSYQVFLTVPVAEVLEAPG